MKKIYQIIGVGLGIVMLVLIRLFEAELFYDPLLVFFKTAHTIAPLPTMEVDRLLVNVGLRFLLNTLVSLWMLWVLFQSKGVLKFSFLLYAVFGSMGAIAFYILLQTSNPGDHMLLFYVRRFLIQPLLLFLLVPAFYVQRIRQRTL